MPMVVYRGPYGSVWLAPLEREVIRDEPVEVPDDMAARLVAGPDWARARKTKEG